MAQRAGLKVSPRLPEQASPIRRKRICVVVSCGFTVRAFLSQQIAALAEKYTVDLIIGEYSAEDLSGIPDSVEVVHLPIARPVSLWRDAFCVISLFKLLRSRKYDAMHSVTPKGGLLMALAGRAAAVNVRIHTFTGQVWATRTGVGRFILKLVDMLIAASATDVLVDSPSQIQFLTSEGVLRHGEGIVLGDGSICGVDLRRFRPDSHLRARARTELGIAEESFLILYVGRLKRDKGILDLATAFAEVAENNMADLVLVGPDEDGLHDQVVGLCWGFEERVRFVSLTGVPEAYMAAADVLCLPSYREGFGNVIIEAAACGVPAVASDIYGITDAIQAGVTGLLHAAGDTAGLARALARLRDDGGLRVQLGAAGLKRAHRLFSSKRLTDALMEFYSNRLDGVETREESLAF